MIIQPGLGLGMFPGSDQNINGKLTTFDVTTESVHAGKIYAMSNIGYVGKFTDETFGTYQAGFLAELNCPKGTTFPESSIMTKTQPLTTKINLPKQWWEKVGTPKIKKTLLL